jgi:hypothetical protein
MKDVADDRRLRFLEEALELRLSEVRSRIALGAVADANVGHVATGDRHEEILRVLMVRLWPRMTRGTATPEDLSKLFQHLRALSEVAGGGDLRFVDAWNNVYEALGINAHADFLSEYAQILETQLHRLRAA